MLTREDITRAIESLDETGEDSSVAHLAQLFKLPPNTVRGHFSNGRFPAISRSARAKRIYDLDTAKAYALWLYMSKDSESVLNFDAIRRDQILLDSGIKNLWSAFVKSDEDLIRVVTSK